MKEQEKEDMKSSRSSKKPKRITLHDFYKEYEYPCYDITSNTVPTPYIPKTKLKCDNKLACDYKTFDSIIQTFNKFLIEEELLTGKAFTLPYNMGEFIILKYKTDNNDKKPYLTADAYRKFRNVHTDGYRPILKWRRSKVSRIKFGNIWRISLLSYKKLISEFLMKDFNNIYKFNDV